MESDDDTFIVIVGDAIDKSTVPSRRSKEVLTKDDKFQDIEQMYLDKNIKGSTRGEQAVEENVSVNDELSTNKDRYLDFSSEDEVPIIYMDKEFPKRRLQIVKPDKRHSYVKKIQAVYPELRNNEKLLIKSLVAIMKETKPPPLPTDYYMMDGIMLQCTTCDHQSVSIPAAQRHYQEKHGERYLYCLACGVNFRSKTNLYKHEKRCNSPDAQIVLKARAKYLGGRGRSRPFLHKGSKKQKPSKKYDCTQCSASFVSIYSLKAHQHMHAGMRPYMCKVCFRRYTGSVTLLRHMKSHNARYVCDHCQRSFNVKAAIVAHMNTHNPLKRFACNECERRFAQLSNLRLHINRDHRGLPPPCACRLCPKRYPRMSVLKDHMMKVHGLQLMTRKMFYKALPTMPNEQVRLAKLVMKSELLEDPAYCFIKNTDNI